MTKKDSKSFFQKLTDSFIGMLPLNSTVREGGLDRPFDRDFSAIKRTRLESDAFSDMGHNDISRKRAKLNHDPMMLPNSRILKANSSIVNENLFNDAASDISERSNTSVSTSGISSLHPSSNRRYKLNSTMNYDRDITIKKPNNLNLSLKIDSSGYSKPTAGAFMSSSARNILCQLDRLTTPVTPIDKLLVSVSKPYPSSLKYQPYVRNAPPRQSKAPVPIKAQKVFPTSSNNLIKKDSTFGGPLRRKQTAKLEQDNQISVPLYNNVLDDESIKAHSGLSFSNKITLSHLPLLKVSKSTSTDDIPKESNQFLDFTFSEPKNILDQEISVSGQPKSKLLCDQSFKNEEPIFKSIKNDRSIEKPINLNETLEPITTSPLIKKSTISPKKAVGESSGFTFSSFSKQSQPESTSSLFSGSSSTKSSELTFNVSTAVTPVFKFSALSSSASITSPFEIANSTASPIMFDSRKNDSLEVISKTTSLPLSTSSTVFEATVSTPSISFAAPKSNPSMTFGAPIRTSLMTPSGTSSSVFGAPSSTPLMSFEVSSSNTSLAFEAPPSSSSTAFVTPLSTSSGVFGTSSSTPSMIFGAPSNTSSISVGAPSTTPTMSFGAPLSTPSMTFGAPSSTPSMTFGAPSSTPSLTFGAPSSTPSMTFGAPSSTPSMTFGAPSSTPSLTFGAPSSTPSLTFGAPSSTPSLTFGAPPSTPSMTFGAPSSTPSIFGAPLSTPSMTFGAPSSTPSMNFGAPSSTPSMTFGAPSSTPSIFGAPSSTPSMTFGAPSSTPSMNLGAPSSTPSITFGAPSSTPSLAFGAPSNTPSMTFGAPSSTPSIFGAPSSTPSMTFGAPSSTPSLTFGAPSSTPGIFGAPSSTPSLTFGAPSSTPSLTFGAPLSTPGIFGAPSNTPSIGIGAPQCTPSINFSVQSSLNTPMTFGAPKAPSTGAFVFGAPPSAAAGNSPFVFGAGGAPGNSSSNTFSANGSGGDSHKRPIARRRKRAT